MRRLRQRFCSMGHPGSAFQSHPCQRNRGGGDRANLVHTQLQSALTGRRIPYIEIPMHIDSLLRRESQWRRRADSNRRIEVLQTSALVHLATAPHISGPAVAESSGLFRPRTPACRPRRSGVGWCRGGDSNSHSLAATAPSTLRVYQFRHLGALCHALIRATLWTAARANSVVATREIIATRPIRPQIRSHRCPGGLPMLAHVQPAAGAFLTEQDRPHKLAAPQRTGVRVPP